MFSGQPCEKTLFQYDPRLKQLPSVRESILFLAESSNQPTVAVPGYEAQPTQAYAVGLRTRSDVGSVLVALWMRHSSELAVFVHERRRLPLAGIEAARDEAWHFCESMGFILDPIPFDAMAPEDQLATLERLPPFRTPETRADSQGLPQTEAVSSRITVEADRPSGHGPTFSPDQLSRLGRLLASF